MKVTVVAILERHSDPILEVHAANEARVTRDLIKRFCNEALEKSDWPTTLDGLNEILAGQFEIKLSRETVR